MRSGKWYRGDGGHVAGFETAYAKLLEARRCLATASGTTALSVSLHVMDVDAGDEVIVSPYTFIATYNAILMSKALPVFADTDPATLTMDPTSIESRITDRTRVIMPVHIYGMPCDMDPINAIARQHKLGVIEDACQAWLAEYKRRKCGNSVISPVSVSRIPSTSHPVKAAPSQAIATTSWIVATPSTMSVALAGASRVSASFSPEAATTECSNFRL